MLSIYNVKCAAAHWECHTTSKVQPDQRSSISARIYSEMHGAHANQPMGRLLTRYILSIRTAPSLENYVARPFKAFVLSSKEYSCVGLNEAERP